MSLLDDRCDLLEFLTNVSHQLRELLNIRQEFTNSHIEDDLYLTSRAIQQYSFNCSQSQMFIRSDIIQDPSNYLQQPPYWDSPRSCDESQASRATQSMMVNYRVDNTDHQYVESAGSANFVNLTQYSAKPSQRQDTGYACRDEALFVPTVNATAMPQLQEYQPECAYCSWLAATPPTSATVPVAGGAYVSSNDQFSIGSVNYANSYS